MDNFNDNNDELIESISEDEDMNALVETLENIPVDDGTIKDNIEISEQILVSSVPSFEEKLNKFLETVEQCTARMWSDTLKSDQLSANGGSRRRHAADNVDDANLMKQEEEDMEATFEEFRRIQPQAIVNCTMKPYQLEGLAWMTQMHESGLNCILADEMGLGKTLQSIAFLACVYDKYHSNSSASVESDPGNGVVNILNRKPLFLVVGPKSTVTNWNAELDRFCPTLKKVIFLGNNEERERIFYEHLDYKNPDVTLPDVIITSFDMIIRERIILKTLKYQVLVLDEAHRLKNNASVLAKTLRTFKTARRVLLTGTPLQNNLTELWSLLNFLSPTLFASADEFNHLFSFADFHSTEQATKAVRALHKTLGAFVLRRLKSDVMLDIPPKKEILVFTPMSRLQRKIYASLLDRNLGRQADSVDSATGSGGLFKNLPKASLLNTLMQLRKCCNHPYLFEGVEPEPFNDGEHLILASSKLFVLDRLLPRLFSEKSRILIFSQMTRMLDIISDWLHFRNIAHFRIDGSTASSERQESIDNFNAPNSKVDVFILSTRAGGLGINLATADVVILFDSDFNPQMDMQAMDRAHRIGQKRPVRVFRMVTDVSVEEKIVERAVKKLKIDALISAGRRKDAKRGQGRNANAQRQELTEMVRHGASEILKMQQDTSVDDGDGHNSSADLDTVESLEKLINIDDILEAAEVRTKVVEENLSKLEEALKGIEDFDLTESLFKLNPFKTGADDLSTEFGTDDSKLEALLLARQRRDFDLKRKNKQDERAANAAAAAAAASSQKRPRVVRVGWRAQSGGAAHHLYDASRLDTLDEKKAAWEAFVIKVSTLLLAKRRNKERDSQANKKIKKTSTHALLEKKKKERKRNASSDDSASSDSSNESDSGNDPEEVLEDEDFLLPSVVSSGQVNLVKKLARDIISELQRPVNEQINLDLILSQRSLLLEAEEASLDGGSVHGSSVHDDALEEEDETKNIPSDPVEEFAAAAHNVEEHLIQPKKRRRIDHLLGSTSGDNQDEIPSGKRQREEKQVIDQETNETAPIPMCSVNAIEKEQETSLESNGKNKDEEEEENPEKQEELGSGGGIKARSSGRRRLASSTPSQQPKPKIAAKAKTKTSQEVDHKDSNSSTPIPNKDLRLPSTIYTKALDTERTRLLSEGFPTWTKKEYLILVNALDKCGLEKKNRAACFTCLLPSKTPFEVEAYVKRLIDQEFYTSIPGGKGLIEAIHLKFEQRKRQAEVEQKVKEFAARMLETDGGRTSETAEGNVLLLPQALRSSLKEVKDQEMSDKLSNIERQAVFGAVLKRGGTNIGDIVGELRMNSLMSMNLFLLSCKKEEIGDFVEECTQTITKETKAAGKKKSKS